MIQLLVEDVLMLGAIGAVTVVGFNRPELAPVTGAAAGAAAGYLVEDVRGCLFVDEATCRRRKMAAIAVGVFMGVGFGILRRDYERAT